MNSEPKFTFLFRSSSPNAGSKAWNDKEQDCIKQTVNRRIKDGLMADSQHFNGNRLDVFMRPSDVNAAETLLHKPNGDLYYKDPKDKTSVIRTWVPFALN